MKTAEFASRAFTPPARPSFYNTPIVGITNHFSQESLDYALAENI